MRPLTIELVETMLSEAISDDNRGEIDRLTRQLDELDERSRRGRASLASAALWYAEQGLHVFPLQPFTKTPWPRSHGCKDATHDLGRIESWWAAAPQSNVGIATGHVVDVIDIDGPQGNVSLARLLEEHPHALDGIVVGQVLTPRPGGRHLYVRQRELNNGAALAPGIDYRGRGGYVVAPPSTTDARDKQVAGVYRWVRALSL